LQPHKKAARARRAICETGQGNRQASCSNEFGDERKIMKTDHESHLGLLCRGTFVAADLLGIDGAHGVIGTLVIQADMLRCRSVGFLPQRERKFATAPNRFAKSLNSF
jgi:hypothetical protein